MLRNLKQMVHFFHIFAGMIILISRIGLYIGTGMTLENLMSKKVVLNNDILLRPDEFTQVNVNEDYCSFLCVFSIVN